MCRYGNFDTHFLLDGFFQLRVSGVRYCTILLLHKVKGHETVPVGSSQKVSLGSEYLFCIFFLIVLCLSWNKLYFVFQLSCILVLLIESNWNRFQFGASMCNFLRWIVYTFGCIIVLSLGVKTENNPATSVLVGLSTLQYIVRFLHSCSVSQTEMIKTTLA